MARRKPNPNEVVINVTPEPLAAPTGESAVVVVDAVAQAVAELEEQARGVAIDSRKKDMDFVPAIEGVLDDVLASLKDTDWKVVSAKEKAIVAGILTDKRKGLLDDLNPQRKQARKDTRSRTKFTFNFAKGTAEVSVDDGGDGE